MLEALIISWFIDSLCSCLLHCCCWLLIHCQSAPTWNLWLSHTSLDKHLIYHFPQCFFTSLFFLILTALTLMSLHSTHANCLQDLYPTYSLIEWKLSFWGSLMLNFGFKFTFLVNFLCLEMLSSKNCLACSFMNTLYNFWFIHIYKYNNCSIWSLFKNFSYRGILNSSQKTNS